MDGVTINKVVGTAEEYGYKTKIDLILPDNLKEGIKPVTIQCSYDGAGIIGAVTKAMQLVQQTGGAREVAILGDDIFDTALAEWISTACNQAGRPSHLLYNGCDSGGASAAAWLRTRDRDLVTDSAMCGGWEDNTVIVVSTSSQYNRENMARCTLGRVIIVEKSK